MKNASSINWTNPSVKSFAADIDPIEAIKIASRKLVLKAREKGWEGPPFNPLRLAEMLEVHVEANSSVADARLIATDSGPKIEFNPQQPRERVRFSIAHEIAHLLFSDWRDQIRNRGVHDETADNWQLELLCNLAASEFVLPIGSLPATTSVAPIEQLMRERREYDVSAEAFLIRLAKISIQPIGIFVASPFGVDEGARQYRIDYFVSSPTAPEMRLSGKLIPDESVVRTCTAIGHTNKASEAWVTGANTQIECVGLPPYPGSRYPRVAGLVRFGAADVDRRPIRTVHGNVLEPRNGGAKIICQLVNDKAIKWGGGIARKMAKRFPKAEARFSDAMIKLPQDARLGSVIFSQADDDITIASLIAQEGFGPSLFPRIRYAALGSCFESVVLRATEHSATIHMPKIGTGVAGGDWSTIEEMLDDVMVRADLSVTIYEIPPKRVQLELI